MGVQILDPEEGDLACGETGTGRLAPVEAIVARALEILGKDAAGPLAGRRIVITGGPTCEDVDPVRTLTSRSSGRMGIALARHARDRGGDVALISGPTWEKVPTGIENVSVRTAMEMRTAVLERMADADVFIASAAVSDFRPADTSASKLKKSEGEEERTLRLVRNPDILTEAASMTGKPGRVIVGFAVETENLEANAQRKLEDKKLDLIVANPVSSFGGNETRAVLLDSKGNRNPFGPGTKEALADTILDAVQDQIQSRTVRS